MAEETCNERLPRHFHSRIDWIRGAVEGTGSEDGGNATLDDVRDGTLCIDKTTVYDICTGTGGPADGFKVYVNQYNEVVKIGYYFADWGDYAEDYLREDEWPLIREAFSSPVAREPKYKLPATLIW